jgi:hypothetical protein
MTATAITFETVDEAIEASVRPVLLYVRIGGEVVNATEAHTRHGVDMLTGTCTIYCPAPRTDAMTINAEIEIEAGYPGATRRIFKGFIPNDESVTDDRGHMLRIDGVGWASRLTWPSRAGVEITGPVSLKDAFRGLCTLREIPTYLSDDTTYVDGSTIMLGGNDLINGGHVRMDSRTAPADWLRRVPPLFGYYVFDSPDGAVRQARVSGLPVPAFTNVTSTMDIAAGDLIYKNSLYATIWNLFADPSAGFTDANVVADLAQYDWGYVGTDTPVVFAGYTMLPVSMTGIGNGWVAAYHVGAGEIYFDKATLDDVMHYQEGVNCYRLQKSRDREPMVTFWEVEGARYTGEDGGVVQIRSIPDEVPYAAELDPPGYQHDSVSSQDLVTDAQAAGVREVLEVDRSEVYELVTWECAARPDLQPGDVVTLTGMHHDLDAQPLWLMSIDQSVTDRGYIARMTGWYGAGQALDAANDCFTVSVGSGTYHVGDENLSHYRDSSPDGTNIVIPITVEFADYSSLRLTGIAHGTNSRSRGGLGNHINTQLYQLPFYTRDRASSIGSTFARKLRDEGYGVLWEAKQDAIDDFNDDYPGYTTLFRKYLEAIVADSKKPGSRAMTGSAIEIWQKPDPAAAESGTNELTRVGTMDLPTLDEELNLRRNYSSSNRYWTAFSLPVPGTLLEGSATLLLVAGSETIDEETYFDDYEVENLQMTYCGIGVPDLPGDAE